MNHVNINLLSTKHRLNSPYTRASPNFSTGIRWSRDRINRAPSNKLKYFWIFCIFFNTHATLRFIPHQHFTVNKISFHSWIWVSFEEWIIQELAGNWKQKNVSHPLNLMNENMIHSRFKLSWKAWKQLLRNWLFQIWIKIHPFEKRSAMRKIYYFLVCRSINDVLIKIWKWRDSQRAP